MEVCMNKQAPNIILLPIIKIHFEINEASIPNQFHYFLLEAVRDKYSIDEIATAMLLKKITCTPKENLAPALRW